MTQRESTSCAGNYLFMENVCSCDYIVHVAVDLLIRESWQQICSKLTEELATQECVYRQTDSYLS